jgi:hypothetical protein
MPVHVHASTLDALTVLAYLIIIGAIWRTTAATLDARGSAFGQAMQFIY